MSKSYFLKKLPSLSKIYQGRFKQSLIVCDSKLKNNLILKSWKKDKASHFYFVKSGEFSKSVEQLSAHLKKIKSLKNFNREDSVFISVGGGSIGDLTGFLSSIYKRGVPVIHVPTTYLAALDSAHGGKTGLNFKDTKNFIGTYHFPDSIFIIEDFFKSLSLKEKKSAYGEVLKMAIISGGSFYQNLRKDFKSTKNNDIKKFIKPCILSKMKIVNKDPYEKKDLRKILNLGHTVGHVLESSKKWSHGEAILYGLLFSLEWSFHKKFITLKDYEEIKQMIPAKKIKLSKSIFKKFLQEDKKYNSGKSLDFIFIKKPGKVFIKSVSEIALIQEAKRQKLI